jgi:hypothetical protein
MPSSLASSIPRNAAWLLPGSELGERVSATVPLEEEARGQNGAGVERAVTDGASTRPRGLTSPITNLPTRESSA